MQAAAKALEMGKSAGLDNIPTESTTLLWRIDFLDEITCIIGGIGSIIFIIFFFHFYFIFRLFFVSKQNSPRWDAAFCLCPIKRTPALYGLKTGDALNDVETAVFNKIIKPNEWPTDGRNPWLSVSQRKERCIVVFY